MRTIKVILDFCRLSLVELIDFALNVGECMDSNPKFPTPDVPLTQYNASLTSLRESHAESLKGSKEAQENVKIALRAFLKLLKLMAMYVNRIADGNEAIIVSAGFNHSKQPAPASRPEFRVLAGNAEGSVVLIRKAVKGAAAYIWQRVPNPLPEDEKQWIQSGISTQAKCVIENLDVGCKYWFRVSPITKYGQMPWCEPIMKLVS